ncbi:cip1-interacting zinc finger protein-like isoform X3 [Echeneis naucrates]|uniref:cip1-interacting zinc finger protein-like isoform X3 n=1 Tax=Echeneis naucrates TaxID=173247 RepID=UPI00111400A4|nr:cip1-interacting zinc finger protein-like isoform X3 [Echeneis naucrates]
MVKQQRRTGRWFLPAAGNSVAQVRFPVGPEQRRQPSPHHVSGRKCAASGTSDNLEHRSSSTTTEEEERGAGHPGPEGGSGGTKRARLDGQLRVSPNTELTPFIKPNTPVSHRQEESAAPTPWSCDQTGSGACFTGGGVSTRAPPPDQESAERSDDSRAAEVELIFTQVGPQRPQPGQLVYIYICVCVCVCARALSQLQSVGSLKVTIQQSSESREFGQTDRTADRQAGGLHCHVCNLTCCSLQVFHEHMSGAEHMKKLHEITNSICLHTHTLQDRGRRPGPRHWCDACQTHFSGDVIVHRRTKQHKLCKQLCRPFCPVCKRHFRTPRKFVEHMKSPEHKQQVHLQDVQEEELITVDAVGCFEEEEEVEEVEEVGVADDEVEEQTEVTEDKELETVDTLEYNSLCTYGSSFVVPVSGFLCRLCNKFFHREATARHTHCRTHTHYLNLQSHKAQRRKETRTEDT